MDESSPLLLPIFPNTPIILWDRSRTLASTRIEPHILALKYLGLIHPFLGVDSFATLMLLCIESDATGHLLGTIGSARWPSYSLTSRKTTKAARIKCSLNRLATVSLPGSRVSWLIASIQGGTFLDWIWWGTRKRFCTLTLIGRICQLGVNI